MMYQQLERVQLKTYSLSLELMQKMRQDLTLVQENAKDENHKDSQSRKEKAKNASVWCNNI